MMFRLAELDPVLHGEVKRRMSLTARMSYLSDQICGPIVTQTVRKYSDLIRTPDHFVEILFLVEDKRFPIHFGIDPVAIVRAVASNMKKGALQGASTIVQQVYSIRRSRTERIPRTLMYKVKQIAWALRESATKSRASILKEYIETVYWGRTYHGLDRAVEGYFGGSRTSLSVAQSFFLAERIAAPNRVSAQRIANLLRRLPIKMNLARNGATILDVSKVYEGVYGNGGGSWQILEK
jgi:membrane peptidoglycan carboxypeptidase